MSLETGAFKVSLGNTSTAKRYPWQPGKRELPIGGTTSRHCHTETSQVEILTKPDTYLLSQVAVWEGRAGLMNPQRIASKNTGPQQSLERKAVRDLPVNSKGAPHCAQRRRDCWQH